jgi:Cu+-exporting ATPase
MDVPLTLELQVLMGRTCEQPRSPKVCGSLIIATLRLDKIVEVVREGQTRRAPIERVADLITGYFVPVITLLAILTWVVWLSLGLSGALPESYLDTHVGGWSKLTYL